MALIGNRHHIEAYVWLPNSLKRQLFKEFSEKFTCTRIQFSNWASGKRPFPVIHGEWDFYITLLQKYDKLWDTQIEGDIKKTLEIHSSKSFQTA